MGYLTADEILGSDPRIEVTTAQSGALSLQGYISYADIDAIADLVEEDLTARDFAVHVLSRILREPELSIEQIQTWDDDTLSSIILTWARHEEVGWPVEDGGTPLEGFQRGFGPLYQRVVRSGKEALTSTLATIRSVHKTLIPQIQPPSVPYPQFMPSLIRMFEQASVPKLATLQAFDMAQKAVEESVAGATKVLVESFQATLQDISRKVIAPVISSAVFSLTDALAVQLHDTLRDSATRLLASLPDLAALTHRLYEQAERHWKAVQVLEETGFGFLADYWYSHEVAIAIGMDHVDPRVRNAVMTNRLLGLTNSIQFKDRIAQDFASTSILRRRWNLIRSAVEAHGQRSYELSIPVLYAQVEGMFTDALVLRGAVMRQNGKLYAQCNGQIKLNKKGDPIELHGLGQAIRNADLSCSPLLEPMADALMNRLFADRNAIMHGRMTRYDQAKRSVTLVLTASILGAMFAELKR